MPIPQNKETLLLVIKSTYQLLNEELANISAELTFKKHYPDTNKTLQ